jgi:hypothetical protein
VKTVQRHLAAIRDEYPGILREDWRDNRKVFWIEAPAGLRGTSLKSTDILTLHVLHKAKDALHALGCEDDAQYLVDFINSVRRNMPNAEITRSNRLLQNLAQCDSLSLSNAGMARIKPRRQMAIIADRSARFAPKSGATVRGKPIRIHGDHLLVVTADGMLRFRWRISSRSPVLKI